MSKLTILAFNLPFAALLVSVILLILAWRLNWNTNPPPEPEETNAPSRSGKKRSLDWRTRVHTFFRQRLWTLILAAVAAALVIYLLVFAPPRLTGHIPITPGQPGSPFNSLRWLRTTLNTYYPLFWTWSTILCSVVSLAILVWAAVRRSRFVAEVGLLAAALTLAGLGQWMIPDEMGHPKLAYAAAAIGFGAWAWLAHKRIKADLTRTLAVPRWAEITFLIGLLTLTSYARLYAFPAVPYGIEGDETKWTSEVVNLMIDGRPDGSGEYHRDALPVSYYMQAAFHRILGASIFSARLEVIFFSILATLVFYWLLRQIAPFPLAALGAFLLSISIFDISASRLANVESHVKLWPILALALLALAIRQRRWQAYALSGAALALGLLTYDTVWPLAIVALILAGIEIVRQEGNAKSKAFCAAALIFPTLLALPLIIPYAMSRIVYYDLGSKGWNADLWGTLVSNLTGAVTTWFVQLRPDFLYNRAGPLLNAFFLPWLVLGFVAVWFALRLRFNRWMLTWALFFLLPVPVLANSQMGRVVYPALPAVYALVAFGMFLFWNEIARLMGTLKPIAAVIAIAVLAWLPLLNFYIYFNEVADPSDQQIRREIGEIAAQAGGPNSLILLPIVPGANEPLVNEHQIIELFLHSKMPASQIPGAYINIPYDHFLPALLTDYSKWPRLEIVLDKGSEGERSQRDQIYAALERCFPDGILTTGTYFDRFSLDQAAREHTACLPVQLDLVPSASASSISLTWALSRGTATEIKLDCQHRKDSLIWVEAEDIQQATGWQSEIAFVTGWSGNGFLMDSYGSQTASYTVAFPNDSQVYVWVRSYKRAVDRSPAFLSLGNKSFSLTGSENLNNWIWERIGPYTISGNNDEWKLARPYSEEADHFMALFVDVLIFTVDSQFIPETSSISEPLPEQSFNFTNQEKGVIPLSLLGGHYECQAQAVSSLPLVDALGNSPVTSNSIEFEVMP